MMSHLKFIPSATGSGFLFNSLTGEVLTPKGEYLPYTYWDYPNIPGPVGIQTAGKLVHAALANHPECKVSLDLNLECAYVNVVTTDSAEGDPAYRNVRIPANEVLNALDPKQLVLSQLGWQA